MTWSVVLPPMPKAQLAEQYAAGAVRAADAVPQDQRAAASAQLEASRVLLDVLVDGLADDASVSVSAGGYRHAAASSVSLTVAGELDKLPPRRRQR